MMSGVMVIFAALWYPIQTLRPASFEYFKLSDWVRYEETQRSIAETRALLEEIAGSYRLDTEANFAPNDRKAQYYALSIILLPIGVGLIVGALAWRVADRRVSGKAHLR